MNKHVRLVLAIAALLVLAQGRIPAYCLGVSDSHKIIETASLAPVFKEAGKLLAQGKKTLVIWDIDNTLLYHDYYLGNEPWFGTLFTNYADAFKTSDPDKYAEEEQKTALLTVLLEMQTPYRLTEKDIAKRIKALQDSGAAVMGQTGRRALVADYTAGQLAGFGVDFSSSAPFAEIDRLPGWDGPRNVVVRRGICFGQLQDKGKILKTLMARFKYKPDAVVFADDSRNNIERIGESLKGTGIAYVGVRYSLLDPMMEKYSTAEIQSAARSQLKEYMASGRLISNEEALARSKKAPVSMEEEVSIVFGSGQAHK